MDCNFVVIGGGIAGVSCAETLLNYSPKSKVTILSASPLVKAVRNLQEITRTLVSFDVEETPIESYQSTHPQMQIHHCSVTSFDYINKTVTTDKDEIISYDKLCICTGAQPNIPFSKNDHVLGIRDTVTSKELELKLQSAEKIAVIGNGGIAIELVFEICNCHVVWIIKDNAIGHVYFDPGAAEFFLPFLSKNRSKDNNSPDLVLPRKRMNYQISGTMENCFQSESAVCGSALGPDWHQTLDLHGNCNEEAQVQLQQNCEVKNIYYNRTEKMANVSKKSSGSEWPVFVELTNGKLLGCDFIVSATGVTPNTQLFKDLPCHILEDGGVEVDENFKVKGLKNVYAAGDVCSTASWSERPQWHQMRLWTQARQMGAFAAQCMVAHCKASNITSNNVPSEHIDNIPLDICFDLFAHVTKFFGKKVCLLGRYNAQGLEKEKVEFLVRTTPGDEYIKVVLMDGQMQGAVLIGDTDLEETFENLILNGTNLSFLGEDLLDPNVDIADYFD